MFISPRAKLWRKVQEFHLATAYRNDEDLRIHVKMILALSFVPIQDVPEAFEDFRSMHRKSDTLDQLLGRHLYW